MVLAEPLPDKGSFWTLLTIQCWFKSSQPGGPGDSRALQLDTLARESNFGNLDFLFSRPMVLKRFFELSSQHFTIQSYFDYLQSWTSAGNQRSSFQTFEKISLPKHWSLGMFLQKNNLKSYCSSNRVSSFAELRAVLLCFISSFLSYVAMLQFCSRNLIIRTVLGRTRIYKWFQSFQRNSI